jgi:type I restriction enzyme S subunit
LVAETINGDRGKNYPNKREYVTEGIPFINTGHIQPDGSLSAQTMHYISREKFESLRSGKIKDGDLIYCLRGATLGKTAFVDPYKEGAIASSLVIIRLDKNMNRRYAFFFLRSPFGRELIRRFDNGSAQPNLAAGSVREYVIPLPPSKEQRRIVAKVDQLMALIDQLEKQQTQKSELAQAFAQAAVAAITGTEIKEPEKMKAPKTELVSRLQTKNTPNADDSAPLAKLLTEHNGELPAEALWQQSGLDIDTFYQQLRTEMAQGWIVEPQKAVMKEVAAD